MKEVEIIKANKNLLDKRGSISLERLRVAAYCRVSTDSEEQLNSYKSQVKYYTELINKNKEWIMVDVYADEAITGTQVAKRQEFQRMVNDCLNDEIDIVITKSISRFARNTLDTLKYVRLLKENNVAVFFEDENINTLTMDGELLLVILSSVAQQEVENISGNVKKGLKMKMRRGELVGFNGCLGYDYDSKTKKITVNREEAEVVKYIFRRYIEGAGSMVIGRELERLGYKTKYGNFKWGESTIIGIIKNEKYIGDLLLGKTFTLDPISKRRLENIGEEDKYYIKDHHEPIIAKPLFEEAQQILNKRNVNRGKTNINNRQKFTRKYAFSCMMRCAYCNSNLSRRAWNSNTKNKKIVWQCVTATKKGKQYCSHSKGLHEKIIEDAFLESYKIICNNNFNVIDEFLGRMENALKTNTSEKEIKQIEKEIKNDRLKLKKLVDMFLENIIDKETYEKKYRVLDNNIKAFEEQQQQLVMTAQGENDILKRIEKFQKMLDEETIFNHFDRYVFESVIDHIVVGEKSKEGVYDPYKLTFVYKTGFKNSVNAKQINGELIEKSKKKESALNEQNICSFPSVDTCRDDSIDVKDGKLKRLKV